jgi:hypothetical protein
MNPVMAKQGIMSFCHGLSSASAYGISFYLKFFSETTTPRKLIFCRDVPWVGLFKFCSPVTGILDIFRTVSQKLKKIAKSSKIFSRT